MSAAVSFYGSRYQQETPTAPTSLTPVTEVQPTGVKQRVGTATIRQLMEAGTPRHQSPLQPIRVRRIANEFDPSKLDVFKVSIDGAGKWWLEDGQHRASAAELAGHLDLEVFVLFVDGMDRRESAEFFLGINDRKQKPQGALIQARAEAGDPFAREMFAMAERHGFRVRLIHSGFNEARNEIRCPDLMMALIERHGTDHVDEVLGVLRAAWDGANESAQKDIIRGISQFLLAYADIDRVELAAKLGGVSPRVVVTEISVARVTERSSSHMRNGYSTGRGVLAIWNHSKRSRRLDDRFNEYDVEKRAADKKDRAMSPQGSR